MPVEITEATIREIRAGCDGATPGPWTHEVQPFGSAIAKDNGCIATAHGSLAIVRVELPHAENAAHIAACDPQTVAAWADDWLRMREALTWYAEQAEGCRKLTREGDTARHALDADGGKRVRSRAARKDQMTGTEGLTAERKFKSKELQDIYEQGWKDALPQRPSAQEAESQDESGWQDIATAPTDGTEVWVYVAEREGLPAFQTRCAHHPDAGWCADELREVTHWRPLPCPPLAKRGS